MQSEEIVETATWRRVIERKLQDVQDFPFVESKVLPATGGLGRGISSMPLRLLRIRSLRNTGFACDRETDAHV